MKCKERTLPDGTIELYDCKVEYNNFPDLTFNDVDFGQFNGTTCLFDHGSCFNWEAESRDGYGITDKFFAPTVSADACVPYRPDINIRPVAMTDEDGVTTFKLTRERSSPVTFPVTAFIDDRDAMEISFDITGTKLVVGELGGEVELELEWDDNPNTNGTAVSTITINGTTWTQTSGEEKGKETTTITLAADTEYPLTFTGLNSANNPNQLNIIDGGKALCLYDGSGDDCNATFSIKNTKADLTQAVNQWKDDGNTYGVWTNPAICTLPCITQQVTYKIEFPATDTYYFEFGADDQGKIFIDAETTPALDIVDGITLNSDSHIHSRQLTAGTHKVVVECTNQNLSFEEEDDNMIAIKNSLLVRADDSEERLSLGKDQITNFNYKSGIARAVAEEYFSGRFGRSGSYPGRGRPPEPAGMATHVDYYVAAGGSLTDDPVDPTIWAATKANSIVPGYNLGEVNLANVVNWYRPSCGVGTPNGLAEAALNTESFQWRYNPGGWFLKICRGGPCTPSEGLDWVLSGPVDDWGSFMNTYAIWPEIDNPLVGAAQSITHRVVITTSDTYTLEVAADNSGVWYWNGTQVASYSGFSSSTTVTFTATPGVYNLRMDVTNVTSLPTSQDIWANNPAGGAWLLTNSNGDIIKSSADLDTEGQGNLFWHTRLATGYEHYVE